MGTATGLKKDEITSQKFFGLYFHFGKLTPLILADVQTADPSADNKKLTLSALPKVVLWPRYIDDTFPPVAFGQMLYFVSAPSAGWDAGSKVYSNVGHDIPVMGYYSPMYPASPPYLPTRNTDGLLEFELKYRAFGATAAKTGGINWTIKNGLYNTPDDVPELDASGDPTGRGVGAGSYIAVRIGSGTPADKKGEETIIFVD